MTALRKFGLLAPLAALSLAGCGINSVPTAEEQVNAEFANLQAEYQRRNDVIGNLVETVKGAAGSEEKILTQVTEARSRATSSLPRRSVKNANAPSARWAGRQRSERRRRWGGRRRRPASGADRHHRRV